MNQVADRSIADRATGEREFWLDAVAGRLGFSRLADALPGNVPPSYLYTLVAVTVPNVLAAVYHYRNGLQMIYADNPYFILQPLLLLAAVYGARSLQREYDLAMVEMNVRDRASDPKRLLDPIPGWVPWGLFGVAVALEFLFSGVHPGWDAMDYLFNFGVFPFVYTPIIVQFFTVYVSIEFIAPWRLSRADDIGIDFLDPQGVGGLRPLGELVKKAYYYVVVGLVGYACITYAPFFDSWTVDPAANALFTGIWVVTVATVGFAVFTLHRFMHREKREEIYRLEQELKRRVDNRWDVGSYEIPEEEEATVSDLRERITRVSETREYPATFSIWSQLLLSIALPKAVQLLISTA